MKKNYTEFIDILEQRGFIHQITDRDGLIGHLKEKPITAYIGFDATATSLHVGSLLQIMMLYWLSKTGNTPVVLMGGGTTKIGDPSGKDEARKLLTKQDIDSNINSIKKIFSQYLEFGNKEGQAIIQNNAEWLDNINYIEFLRDIGRHFSVNKMLQFDSVRLRLDREQPLSFLEFNYMILQAYDFYELSKRHDCALQLGGSDQWGNIVNGIDLIRRLLSKSSFGITTPLITKASGEKMGKTAGGAVWLNSDMLSDYNFWQYWRNCDDRDVIRFLKLFTTLSLRDIKHYEGLQGSEINDAKILLANEITAMARGRLQAENCEKTAKNVFQAGGVGNDLPTIIVEKNEIGLLDALTQLNFCKSNSEARRLIQQDAIKINDRRCDDINYQLSKKDIIDENYIKISAGKKKIGLVKI